MTEPTIEQLIDDVIEDAKDQHRPLSSSRSALLSRIEAVKQESDAWHKMADEFEPKWVVDNSTGNGFECDFCEKPATPVCNFDCDEDEEDIVWECNHDADCPIAIYNALTARYSHEKEGE